MAGRPPNSRARRKAARAQNLPAARSDTDSSSDRLTHPTPPVRLDLVPFWRRGMFLDALIGIIFVLGIAVAWRSHHFLMASVHTPGVVSEVETRPGRRSGYRVVAQYVDGNGIKQTYRASYSTSWPSYQAGDPVTVIYDPRDPARGGLLTFADRFGVAWVLLGCGVFAAFLRVGFVWGERWLALAYKIPAAP